MAEFSQLISSQVITSYKSKVFHFFPVTASVNAYCQDEVRKGRQLKIMFNKTADLVCTVGNLDNRLLPGKTEVRIDVGKFY